MLFSSLSSQTFTQCKLKLHLKRLIVEVNDVPMYSEDYNTINSCACFLLALNRLSAPSPGNSPISVQLRTNFVDSWSLFSGKKEGKWGHGYNKTLEFCHFIVIKHLRCTVISVPMKIFLKNTSLFSDCCLARFFCRCLLDIASLVRRNSRFFETEGY